MKKIHKTNRCKALLAMLLLAIVCTSCNMNDEPDSKQEYSVCLLSFGDYPEAQLLNLQQDIQNCFDTLIPEITVTVEVMGNKPIPDNCRSANHNRLRADSLLRFQNGLLPDKETYLLGITAKDISTTVHGVDDWGVLGLSYRPGHAAVVSSCRVKNKQLFYKVAVHELLHSFGLPHCGNKDRSCYICDADKRPQLEKQTRLCPDCKDKLLHKTR